MIKEDAWLPIASQGAPIVGKLAHAISLAPICESPIEVMLGSQLKAISSRSKLEQILEVIPQFCLGRFRYDFALRLRRHPTIITLIECDGKEFHSTPEQIENDLCKNAAATAAGMHLMRFTGAEIYRDDFGCATRAILDVFGRAIGGKLY